MVLLYRKTLVHVSCCVGRMCSVTRALHFFRNHPLLPPSSYLRSISTSSNQQHSFTVSYLINSCGFTPEQAQKASQIVKFETADKPDSVRSLFRDHGFSATQISSIIRKEPNFLIYDPNKIFLPKLEFLYSIGFSKADLAKRLTAYPKVLKRSLKKQIIPSYNFYRDLLQSDSKVIAAVKRYPGILVRGCTTSTHPNVEHMRQLGVPESNIVHLLADQPRTVDLKPEKFTEVVKEVKQMGLSPSSFQFVVAVHVVASMSKSTWQRKVEVFGNWGWSEEQRLVAFQKNPLCMKMSEDKIMAVMDFLVHTMGLEPLLIAQRPTMLLFSLEKRIIPRYSVFQALLSKGLKKKRIGLFNLFQYPESVFLQRFVFHYKEEAAQLLKLYEEKMGLKK